jgi:hypothetical protein
MKPKKSEDPSEDIFVRLIAAVDADMEHSGLRNWLRERYAAAGLQGEGEVDEREFLHWVKSLAARFAAQDTKTGQARSTKKARKSARR